MKSEEIIELISKEPITHHDLLSKWEELNPDLSLSAFTMQLHRLRKIHSIQKDSNGKYIINFMMLKEQIKEFEDLENEYDLADKIKDKLSRHLFLEIVINYIPEETLNKAIKKVIQLIELFKKTPEKKPIEVIINKKNEVIKNE